MGDTAHATMEPFQAQRAAQAIEDALALADCVESDGVVEALEQYGKVRMSRAADLQVSSRLRRWPLLSRRRRGVAGTRRGSCDATRPAPFGPSAAHLGIRRSRRSARGQEGEQCRVQPLTGCALNIPTRALARSAAPLTASTSPLTVSTSLSCARRRDRKGA